MLRGQDLVAQPVQQALTIGCTKKEHGKPAEFCGLDQDQGFKHFVERTEAAGKEHKAPGVFHEHGLADKEIAEVDRDIDIGVDGLLARQVDVTANRDSTAFPAATY